MEADVDASPYAGEKKPCGVRKIDVGDGILNLAEPGKDSGGKDKGSPMTQEGLLPQEQAADAESSSAHDGDAGGATQATEADQHVGRILRTAYQSMVDEAIPDEMLNLLNRLD